MDRDIERVICSQWRIVLGGFCFVYAVMSLFRMIV
jgi:hypothetical protein